MTGRTTKFIAFDDTTLGVAGQSDAEHQVDKNKENCSNIWASFSVEPENADANSQGWWVLWSRGFDTPLIQWSDVSMSNQKNGMFVIACGAWGATNQTPYNSGAIGVKTSRNIRDGGSLVMSVHQTGITAGNSSVKVLLCCNVTTL